ncbi:SDR family oxidoreductase [Allokutzneria albata]|uniref:NADP-dependent 3-hydroxy acid dehydrogenase YdfG n=1 Tax=Allokutzneria albata TaxID=211114 RepID=A0A1G9S3V7_ALLAB|nr:SDR family NAD(P)-dependent oxidoreductase [Allokutzneria albata]SDM29445.1 NADP-dependent 3-hydroxy acid dehydrogenase YdfG [Allokutzneria albata]
MTHRELSGTVALVTGASSGIGEAVAHDLAQRGATVVVVARRRERLARVVAEIEGKGGRAFAVPADLTDRDQATAAVADAVKATGRLDILVNNAGVGFVEHALEADLDRWRQTVEINLLAVLSCTHAALPHLVAAAEGPRGIADVVTISSVAGRVTAPGYSVYAATKHAVGAFSDSIRKELVGRVRVGLVEPGAVDTELTDASKAEFEWLRPQDVADAVAYLVTRPKHAAVSELLLRPSAQER